MRRAVDRNRLRRRLRESVRARAPVDRGVRHHPARQARRAQRRRRGGERRVATVARASLRIAMKRLLLAALSRLPVPVSPAARRQLPLLPELLGLRARGDRAPWRSARRVARGAAHRPLPSVSSGRLRSRPLTAAAVAPAHPDISPPSHSPKPSPHGHATPDSLAGFLLLRADALAGVGTRAQSAAGADKLARGAAGDAGRKRAHPFDSGGDAAQAPRPRPHRRRRDRRSKSIPISTRRTSTPSAARSTRVALAQASRCAGPVEALSRAAAQRGAHVRRAGRPHRRRISESPHRLRSRCRARERLHPDRTSCR